MSGVGMQGTSDYKIVWGSMVFKRGVWIGTQNKLKGNTII